MKSGRSKEKGSSFEREVGRQLSRWVSKDARSDLFTRNVLSGGDFTRRSKTTSSELGMPGDLMARHPLAFQFAQTFMVECKHYKELGLASFIFDRTGSSFLSKTLAYAQLQASQASQHYMVVAKQNYVPTLLFVGKRVGERIRYMTRHPSNLTFHIIHDRYFVTHLSCLLDLVEPEPFIRDCKDALQIRRRSRKT